MIMEKYNVAVKVSAFGNKPVILNILYIPPDGYSPDQMKKDIVDTVFNMTRKYTKTKTLHVEIVSFRQSRIDCIIQH